MSDAVNLSQQLLICSLNVTRLNQEIKEYYKTDPERLDSAKRQVKAGEFQARGSKSFLLFQTLCTQMQQQGQQPDQLQTDAIRAIGTTLGEVMQKLKNIDAKVAKYVLTQNTPFQAQQAQTQSTPPPPVQVQQSQTQSTLLPPVTRNPYASNSPTLNPAVLPTLNPAVSGTFSASNLPTLNPTVSGTPSPFNPSRLTRSKSEKDVRGSSGEGSSSASTGSLTKPEREAVNKVLSDWKKLKGLEMKGEKKHTIKMNDLHAFCDKLVKNKGDKFKRIEGKNFLRPLGDAYIQKYSYLKAPIDELLLANDIATGKTTTDTSSRGSKVHQGDAAAQIVQNKAAIRETLRHVKNMHETWRTSRETATTYTNPNNNKQTLLNYSTKEAAKAVELFATTPQPGQRAPRYNTEIILVDQDCREAAQTLAIRDHEAGKKERVFELDMANSHKPGGGAYEGARAQEEQLCYTSDLLAQLDPERKYQPKNFYPLHNHSSSAGLYLPQVLFFRDKDLQFLDQPYIISVGAVAAFRLDKGEPLQGTKLTETRNKVRMVLEMAYTKGHRTLVLSAFGGGAFKNPPEMVAPIFMEELHGDFKNCFEQVVFAIIDDHNTGGLHNPIGNYLPFADEIKKRGGRVYRGSQEMDVNAINSEIQNRRAALTQQNVGSSTTTTTSTGGGRALKKSIKQIGEIAKKDGYVWFYEEQKNPLTARLGNYSPCEMKFNGRTYPCLEAAYQAQKVAGQPQLMDQFTSGVLQRGHYSSIGEAAWRLGQTLSYDKAAFKKNSEATMRKLVEAKFRQSDEHYQFLRATGNAYLVECSDIDPYWGDGINPRTGKRGENMLGKILMDTRKNLGGKKGRVDAPQSYLNWRNQGTSSSALD